MKQTSLWSSWEILSPILNTLLKRPPKILPVSTMVKGSLEGTSVLRTLNEGSFSHKEDGERMHACKKTCVGVEIDIAKKSDPDGHSQGQVQIAWQAQHSGSTADR